MTRNELEELVELIQKFNDTYSDFLQNEDCEVLINAAEIVEMQLDSVEDDIDDSDD
jgi:hypothetical protein